MKIKIRVLLILFICPILLLSAEPVKWDTQYQVSPSVFYQSCTEHRQNFHHQIHHVRIDLQGTDVSLEVACSEDFPRKPENLSSIMSRKKAQVAVPASLIIQSGNNRNLPLGNLRTSSGVFTLGHAYPEVRVKSLNQIVFDQNGDDAKRKPYIITEQSETITTMGLNSYPDKPGFYLFSQSFQYVKKEEIDLWGIELNYLLEKVSRKSNSNLYWVEKILEGPRDIDFKRDTYILSLVGKPSQETPIFKRHDRMNIIIPDEIPGQPLLGRFCSGPYFLHEGKYNEESVRILCRKTGAPSFSHYEQLKARLVLGMGRDKRYLDIYCVDEEGIKFQGMSLKEFAEFLSEEGVEEAIALPDGDAASLIMGDQKINTTPKSAYPVFTALCISEHPPEEGERINLLTRIPNRIMACGSSLKNSPMAIKDGSIGLSVTLDNYWEHISEDSSHKHGILIDLYKSYQVEGLELFYAEEAGFSSQFNWRSFTIATSEADKNNLREMMSVENPQGYSHQYIPFSPDTFLRYMGIEIIQPTLYPDNQTARLVELVVWGKIK